MILQQEIQCVTIIENQAKTDISSNVLLHFYYLA